MAFRTEFTGKAGNGLDKAEAKKLFLSLMQNKKAFDVVGGHYRECKIASWPQKGKVEHLISLVETLGAIPVPLARHFLSVLEFDPSDQSVNEIKAAIVRAEKSLAK